MLLLKEGTIERMSDRIIEKFKAVEDLNGATFLNTDDATEDTRRKGRNDAIAAVAVSRVVRGVGWVHLRFNPCVMIGDVHDH